LRVASVANTGRPLLSALELFYSNSFLQNVTIFGNLTLIGAKLIPAHALIFFVNACALGLAFGAI
jgi:hypothetical protein